MRRALLVGIDNYEMAPLVGCVSDVEKMASILTKNQDGSPNFACKKIIDTQQDVTRALVKYQVEELLKQQAEIALFYFSGHGSINNIGGFLVTQDTKRYDEGVSMHEILKLVNNNSSGIREVVIILDCCHSGAFGAVNSLNGSGEQEGLREGVTVLTASRGLENALEISTGGLFTSLIHDALLGGAADVMGNITMTSVYAYIDQILGPWDQRPLFKSHVSHLSPLRKVAPKVEIEILRLLPQYFELPDIDYPLDPSYEPDNKGLAPKNIEHEKIFAHFQKYRTAALLEPLGEEHLYFAAMNSGACHLTPLGRFYWLLASQEKI